VHQLDRGRLPLGSLALLPKLSKTTTSDHGDASSRWKIQP